ncbi:MAG: DUF3455 domain-containing protein [Betaproteobacteria bacterium]
MRQSIAAALAACCMLPEPATGMGAMSGVTYIQRVNTKGGIAPSEVCTSSSDGVKKLVPYQADYVFYKS